MPKQMNINSAAYEQLNQDADRILHLIKVQMDNLTMPSCPLYEEGSRHTNVWFTKRSRLCCETWFS